MIKSKPFSMKQRLDFGMICFLTLNVVITTLRNSAWLDGMESATLRATFTRSQMAGSIPSETFRTLIRI